MKKLICGLFSVCLLACTSAKDLACSLCNDTVSASVDSGVKVDAGTKKDSKPKEREEPKKEEENKEEKKEESAESAKK
jgi:ribosomal protein L12E/L44/L45/RPP1/RPP2